MTIDANLKCVDFLDISMDLDNDIFKPLIKPNTIPLYIHSNSNHPPTILKNLPAAIHKRLSSISCNKTVFESAAPSYQDALSNSGKPENQKTNNYIRLTCNSFKKRI